jgi:glycosyltransferase involved in cell wall biosynthesis
MAGRVLLVAYNFPPVGGVGMLRTLKYATYLPDSGWEPVVLTAENPGSGFLDEEALRDLPAGLAVERAFSPEPVKLRRLLGRTARRTAGSIAGTMRPAHGREPARSDSESAGAGVRAEAAALPARFPWQSRASALWSAAVKATFFPDDEVGWVPFAVGRGLEIHCRQPLDVIYSSSPPVSSHLAAAAIARQTGLPWVADFRDPWIGNAFAEQPGGLHGFLQRKIERRIVAVASRIVFASGGMTEAYAARYPWARHRFVTIPNGYDRADLPTASDPTGAGSGGPAGGEPAASGSEDGRFHLVYGGSIYGEHELELFLEGLEALVARRPDVRDRLSVEFIGWLNLHNQAVAAGFATPDRLGSMVRFTGFLPHREAVARLARADALLQIIAGDPNKGQIQGGKLMEYVGLDRQILAVVPPGRARDLLAELDWGVVADPTPQGVADGLERLLATPAPARRADPEGRYDRVNLTRRFATVLDEVGESRGSAPTLARG